MVLALLKKALVGSPKPSLLPSNNYSAVNYAATDDDGASSSTLSFEGVSNPRVISDVIIGLSDGLTVPFALTAGLSSLGSTHLVITGGFAELVSGALSMGIGGYLAAQNEREYFNTQLLKERAQFRDDPAVSAIGVNETLGEYNLSPKTIQAVLADLQSDEDVLSSFMVKFVRGIEEPASNRAMTSALTIGISYFLAGFVPMIPYFFTDTVETGLIYSVVIMTFALLLFGYFKTLASLGSDCKQSARIWNAFSMLITGGTAAGAAWLLVKVIET